MICRTCHGRGVVYEVPEGIDLTWVRPASVPHLVAPMSCPRPAALAARSPAVKATKPATMRRPIRALADQHLERVLVAYERDPTAGRGGQVRGLTAALADRVVSL